MTGCWLEGGKERRTWQSELETSMKSSSVTLLFLEEKGWWAGCLPRQAFISALPVLHRQEKVTTFSSFVIVKNKNIIR